MAVKSLDWRPANSPPPARVLQLERWKPGLRTPPSGVVFPSRPLYHDDLETLYKLDMSKPSYYEYQREGILAIEKFAGRTLLADDPGLGKTGQALGWAKNFLEPSEGPIIVACPDFLRVNWEREIEKFTGWQAAMFTSRTPPIRNGLVSPYRICIINYNVLQDWEEYILSLKPALFIADECHFLKNIDAKRTKTARNIAKKTPYVIGISGTPLTNRPIELYPMLNMIRPDIYKNYFEFGQRYCKPEFRMGRWRFTGSSNLQELNASLRRNLMVRRLKRDVLSQLPPKQRFVVPMEIDAWREYDEAKLNFLKWLAEIDVTKARKAAQAEALAKTGYLKRLAAELKLPNIIKWITNFLETNDSKLIVFGIHKKVLKPLHEHFKDYSVLVDGECSPDNKTKFKDKFNTDPRCRLFFGNIETAGTGWSCPVASDVAFVELDWRPALHTQAEDRVHGLGRGISGTVSTAHYLVARDTIEEKLVRILDAKQRTINATLDGDEEAESLDILDQLLDILKEELNDNRNRKPTRAY